MFQSPSRLDCRLLLAPLALAFGILPCNPARAQIVIIREPQHRNLGGHYPVQYPADNRGSYLDVSPIMNASPRPSPILQPVYPAPRPSRHHHRSTSNTTVIVNPTIVVPGNRVYGYPYPVNNSGFSVYYGTPSNFGVQIGY